MRRYANHDWTRDPTNLLITSPTGGGKTYLICAIGLAACHREQSVTYARMDDLARQLVITRSDAIAHRDLLDDLSSTDLLIIDDFLTIGIDERAASDLFAILANREYHRPTIIASQSNPDYWARTLPDRVAADSIVNRLASNARKIHLGDTDMRKRTHQTTKNTPDDWE